MIRALADRVILADGWARAALAVATGAVGALAMPPFGVWPALAVSLTAAVWLLDGSAAGPGLAATLRRAALAGWLWGFGYFVASLWWIGAAFLVEADTFAWLLPLGVVGLPAYLAVFPALGFALARAMWSPGAGRLFALAAGLGLSEWLRGHAATGFPWNAFGLAFGQSTWLMQSASLVGMTGLSVLAVLALASPAVLGTGESPAARAAPPALGALALLAMAGFGAWRVSGAPPADVPGVRLRIMQPNLAQDAKFRPSNGPAILRDYLALSEAGPSPDAPGLAGITHLVWPESAFPFLLAREPNALAAIAATLPPGGQLITGAARGEEPLPGEAGGRFFNAIQVVGPDGAVAASYDKVHLVPFGEYVPALFEAALQAIGARQFVSIPGGFSPGERRAPLRVPGLPPAAAAICYEAIFPDEVMPEGARPGLILNVTNDGWFGDTPGPYQHLAQARMRAVERGLPLVRAANTGISAVTDGYGRVVAALPLGRRGAIDTNLPETLSPPLFARYETLMTAGPYTMCILTAMVARRRSRRAIRRPVP